MLNSDEKGAMVNFLTVNDLIWLYLSVIAVLSILISFVGRSFRLQNIDPCLRSHLHRQSGYRERKEEEKTYNTI